ncbi:hypothetical protein P4133_16035 [Pseudomonas aeruginosa]|nr:hypothetical protein [Pseudomonas aeruginosa]
MVEAGERMGEAGDQAVFAVAGVGEGQRRRGEQGEGGEQLGSFIGGSLSLRGGVRRRSAGPGAR